MFKIGDEVKVVAVISDSNYVLNKVGRIVQQSNQNKGERYKIKFQDFDRNNGYWWLHERALELTAPPTPEEEFWRNALHE